MNQEHQSAFKFRQFKFLSGTAQEPPNSWHELHMILQIPVKNYTRTSFIRPKQNMRKGHNFGLNNTMKLTMIKLREIVTNWFRFNWCKTGSGRPNSDQRRSRAAPSESEQAATPETLKHHISLPKRNPNPHSSIALALALSLTHTHTH